MLGLSEIKVNFSYFAVLFYELFYRRWNAVSDCSPKPEKRIIGPPTSAVVAV